MAVLLALVRPDKSNKTLITQFLIDSDILKFWRLFTFDGQCRELIVLLEKGEKTTWQVRYIIQMLFEAQVRGRNVLGFFSTTIVSVFINSIVFFSASLVTMRTCL